MRNLLKVCHNMKCGRRLNPQWEFLDYAITQWQQLCSEKWYKVHTRHFMTPSELQKTPKCWLATLLGWSKRQRGRTVGKQGSIASGHCLVVQHGYQHYFWLWQRTIFTSYFKTSLKNENLNLALFCIFWVFHRLIRDYKRCASVLW